MLEKRRSFKNTEFYCVLRGFFEVRLFRICMNMLCRTLLKRFNRSNLGEKTAKINICLTENAQVIFSRLGYDPGTYGTAYEGESSGLDLYNMGQTVNLLGRNKWVAFGEREALIPTGVRISIPKGYVGIIKERGSIVKTGLSVRAGVLDPGFTGEVFVSLTNLGERDTKVDTGAKLPVQLIVVSCANSFNVVSYSEFLEENLDSNRQQNQIGSTNKEDK